MSFFVFLQLGSAKLGVSPYPSSPLVDPLVDGGEESDLKRGKERSTQAGNQDVTDACHVLHRKTREICISTGRSLGIALAASYLPSLQ